MGVLGWLIHEILPDLLTLAISWIYVFLAPYTKVEESFNLHAIHDVLMYGVRPEFLTKVCHSASCFLVTTDIACTQYDHKTFPGAVPRTFVASILLGWLTAPAIYLGAHLDLTQSKMDLQIARVSCSMFDSPTKTHMFMQSV